MRIKGCAVPAGRNIAMGSSFRSVSIKTSSVKMTTLLRHWYHLFCATVWLALAFARASWYFKNRALHDLALPHPESLTSKEKRRLKHYFYGTTYLSAVFCILRGRTRTRREKHLFTNLAALAYFFDDLVDAFRGNDDSGILWQDNPEEYGHTADPRGLALHFLQNVYRELPPGDLAQFKDFMHRVFNVEVTKVIEKNNSNDLNDCNDLISITSEKGGYSVLMFRRILSNPLSLEEQEALFQFGYFVQLCDDIFDLWHDRQAGTATLATFFAEKNDVAGLRVFFEKQVGVVRGEFLNSSPASTSPPTPPLKGRGDVECAATMSRLPSLLGEGSGVGLTWGSARAAYAAIHFLVAITRVCLRHYEDLQKKHGTLPLDDRAAMVVDMERWGNRVRAARELLSEK